MMKKRMIHIKVVWHKGILPNDEIRVDELNAEWQDRDEFTEEYDQAAKQFADEVARR